MRKRMWKLSKTVLPWVLSAMMVVEPMGAMSTVYAQEAEPFVETADLGQNDETDQTPTIGVEKEKPEISDGAETDLGEDANKQEESDDVQPGEGEGKDADSDNTDENAEPVENPAQPGDDNKDEGNESEDGTNGEPEENDAVSDNDLNEQEAVSENDLDNEETDAALNGFKGMPDSYKLTAEQMENKRILSDHMGEISGFTEGADYVKGQVVTEAESQEEAEMIAEAYNAKIVRFEYGILTLQLEEDMTVNRAVMAASDSELNLPAVWPNYYRYLMDGNLDGIEIETTEYEADAVQEGLEASPETSYGAALTYTDAYLQPTSDYYQWHHTVIGSPYVWGEGYTGSGIKVAVLDSGVQASHSDLPAINSVYGQATTDSVGHGTHVAGIIAAQANGMLGVGVAPEVTLYSGNLGGITSAEIMGALEAVKGKGIHLVNMSIGGLGFIPKEQEIINELYNEGTAIFASAGNDGGQTYSYPACYDHVISVAATDKNNERASFSSYSNMVDLSAPGVAIWSADAGNNNGYVAMDGTSMACPVAVGEAAVILSGDKDLRETSGAARVDKLENLMKKNAIKAGSGMGAGITSLTKVFGLSMASAKPVAPNIEITPDDTAQKVTVKITAQAGTIIYFTKNGKNPAFKNGDPDVKSGTKLYTGRYDDSDPLVINNQSKATIKAIAVNESGVASAVKSATYTLKPYVTRITISGPQRVVPKKSIQLSADVLPAYATNKKVSWELYTAKQDGTKGDKITSSTAAVKIAVNGKVTATKDATAGKYIAVAKAKDAGGVSAEYAIEVITDSIFKDVKFYGADDKVMNKATVTLPTETSYNLAQFLRPVLVKEGTTWTAADFKWSSNKKDVAQVSSAGVVIPRKAGKATITALADDSSGKKASVTVTVIQLATGISISGPNSLAATKSAAFKATIRPTGVNNKKVVWEIYDSAGTKIDPKANAATKSIGVSINASNGKVSATKDAKAGKYTVKAITQDSISNEAGQIAAEKKITVTSGIINKVSFSQNSDKNVKLFRTLNGYTGKNSADINVKIAGSAGADLSAYTVSNSNAGIATWEDVSTEANKSAGDITLRITATGRAVGSTKITITSADGSNKKLTCTVKVVNPVSAITIAPAAGTSGAVAQGKSLQLKARAESEYGAITNKNVSWELYTATYKLVGDSTVIERGSKVDSDMERQRGIKIAANGKITATRTAVASIEYPYIDEDGTKKVSDAPAPYIVRATTKDESGTYGEYTITVGECGNKIRLIWPKEVMKDGQLVQLYYEDGTPVIDWQNGEIWEPSIKYRMPKGYWGYGILGNIGQGGYTVSSSNPKIASVTYKGVARNAGYLIIQAYGKGAVTFTITAQDGSGTQVKYSVLFE